jgi:hypothetical protein
MCIIPNFVIPHGRFFPMVKVLNSLFLLLKIPIGTAQNNWARISKRLWSPGIDSEESIPPGWELIPGRLRSFTRALVHKHLNLSLPSSLSPHCTKVYIHVCMYKWYDWEWVLSIHWLSKILEPIRVVTILLEGVSLNQLFLYRNHFVKPMFVPNLILCSAYAWSK